MDEWPGPHTGQVCVCWGQLSEPKYRCPRQMPVGNGSESAGGDRDE